VGLKWLSETVTFQVTAYAVSGRVTVIALSDDQGEVTTAILRLDSRKELGDVFE
jgi:hypothetical protein